VGETVWYTRLRWRMRGAWLWPAFVGLTVIDGVLINRLPPYGWTPPGIVGALLLAGFANLLLLAVAAPPAGILLRRRRRDLPRPVAFDYAGTSLFCALTLVLVVAGVAHRPAVAARDDDAAALSAAVHAYVMEREPEWAGGLDAVAVREYAPEVFRACVPGADPTKALCLIVDTDRRPPAVHRDESMQPNR
jgi:hypothetical protein